MHWVKLDAKTVTGPQSPAGIMKCVRQKHIKPTVPPSMAVAVYYKVTTNAKSANIEPMLLREMRC